MLVLCDAIAGIQCEVCGIQVMQLTATHELHMPHKLASRSISHCRYLLIAEPHSVCGTPRLITASAEPFLCLAWCRLLDWLQKAKGPDARVQEFVELPQSYINMQVSLLWYSPQFVL